VSGTVASKFFWPDWRSDPCLRTSSLAARGLWMEMLCIAAEAQPTGYVLVNGRSPSITDLARLAGAPEDEVQSLLAELDAAGVFSRDRKGRIYSRRMVRDLKRSVENQKNGKKGGNPLLCNYEQKTYPVNPSDNGEDKPPLPSSPSISNPPTPQGGNFRKGRGREVTSDLLPELPWRARCLSWAKGRSWDRAQWGAPPNEPGCEAPPDVIAEALAFRKKAAA
jgi:hypothetical protein